MDIRKFKPSLPHASGLAVSYQVNRKHSQPGCGIQDESSRHRHPDSSTSLEDQIINKQHQHPVPNQHLWKPKFSPGGVLDYARSVQGWVPWGAGTVDRMALRPYGSNRTLTVSDVDLPHRMRNIDKHNLMITLGSDIELILQLYYRVLRQLSIYYE